VGDVISIVMTDERDESEEDALKVVNKCRTYRDGKPLPRQLKPSTSVHHVAMCCDLPPLVRVISGTLWRCAP